MTSANLYGDFEITDPKTMRALAHPVRLALLDRLQRHGPATASRLAPHVGATPSVTSWHLRHLVRFGLVRDAEPDTEPDADRRERRWEASSRGFRFNGSVGGEEGHAAARQLADQMFERASELSLRWATDTAPELEPEWQEASGLSDTRIVATPQELAQIAEAMEAVLAPYVLRAPADASAGARGVLLLRYVLPERSGDE